MKKVMAIFAFSLSATAFGASVQLAMDRFDGIYDLVNTSGSVQAPDDLCWPRRNHHCADEEKFKQDTIANICPKTVIVDVGTPPGRDEPAIGVYFGDPRQGYLPHAIFDNSNGHFADEDSKHRETAEPNWVSSYDITGSVKNFSSLKMERGELEFTTLHRDVHIRDSFYTDWNLDCKYARRP